MLGVIVRPMARGQITLPKKYREKLKISPKTLLNIVVRGGSIVVTPLEEMIDESKSEVIEATVSKRKYLEELKKFPGGLWTGEDDTARKEMRKKEKKWDW